VNDGTPDRSDSDSRSRILASAREQIERRGILGLRVADVARGANTSITLIYRHFADRDGLLAQVLGDIYDEAIVYWESIVDSWQDRNVGYSDLIAIMPMPEDAVSRTRRNLRLQILATAVNNPRLRDRLGRSTQRFHVAVQRAVELIREQTGERNPLDPRIYALMLLMFNTMFVSNDLLGDNRITDADYVSFLEHFFARYDAPA
jgi:AcrR family transcriptional regulator